MFPPRATITRHLSSTTTTTTTTATTTTITVESDTISKAVTALTNLKSRRRWSTLRSLFPNGPTPEETTEILLQIRHNPRLSLSFFNFSSTLSPPHLRPSATLIHTLTRSRLLTRSRSLIHQSLLSSQTAEIPNLLFKELLHTYRASHSTPLVFDLLIQSLLQLTNNHTLHSVLEIVKLLQTRGFAPHIKTCNALVSRGCREKGSSFGYDLYKDLFSWVRVPPNVHTFNELMYAFHRDGDVGMVEELWIEMCGLGVAPKVCSYNILMAAYCERGEVDKAQAVWEEMRRKGLRPDVVSYNTMIGGYCRGGEVGKGEEVYREMGLNGLEGTSVTYQHLVYGYCSVGDAASALMVYKDMCRKGFELDDGASVDAMVRVVCDKMSALEGLEFFEKVVMGGAEFVARETSYECLIEGLCREGTMDEALRLQAQMVGKGFKPSLRIYSAFIDGYVKLGKNEIAERLREEMLATQT